MDTQTPASSVNPPLGENQVADGYLLRQLLNGAVEVLARRSKHINNLNVFPVPDGDTGTNLLLTMRTALKEAAPAASVGRVSAEVARGALMGARGNSGVILSQYLRGFAEALAEHDVLDAPALARALAAASSVARAAVSEPVEGTILTVARDVAALARARADAGDDLASVLTAAAAEADRAVERTPDQLPILREAGVVDAGGVGLATMLDGMARTMRGEELPAAEPDRETAPAAIHLQPASYGFCTEFLIHGADLDLPAIRRVMGQLGDSLLVVGDARLARVHLHTLTPGRAIDLAVARGAVDQVKIENMQQQNAALRATAHQSVSGLVVVTAGDGFARLYRSLGASAIVSGGTTMNPSAEEIARAGRFAHAQGCVVLPNNRNVALAAEQARSLVDVPIAIVPTTNSAQGIAAALAFDPNQPIGVNQRAMERAMAAVRTGEITVAIRAATIDGKLIAEGSLLGLVDGRVEVVGDALEDVVGGTLARLRAAEAEVVTLYVGSGVAMDASEALARRLRQELPSQQVELIFGGQPHYAYLLACE